MSTFAPQFQIISDLHLETPLASPAYTYFTTHFPLEASNLFLLGDIGLARHDQLFAFLRSLLTRTPNLKIFYVLGNHEAYGITMAAARAAMRNFEAKARYEFGDRFFFMNRRRVDLTPTITILGCTLWSRIEDTQAAGCANALTDFHEINGIRNRSVEAHNGDHERDLAWLNEQVEAISSYQPERQVIVLTHHSPTTDPRASDSRHAESSLSSGFRTDLSGEVCWKSRSVKMDGGKKLVVSKQKGYAQLGGKGVWKVTPLVVEAGEGIDGWKVVDGIAGERSGREVETKEEKEKTGRPWGKWTSRD
ncbi:hypothetical protein K458DRAFT_369061 [Lentithecium fluviatile CBS 122367]|uniref:Calcineurin-like phosphoesterase domain-containing protein n=1 Tax=Lentithecium fluviatile CBS 122367 TaxID=1168545 RepID=A0A6G1IXH3_9PLEO|nr:hypothetical protein K458DRAFT_369061 [Lentithecium fluviatile CBS 122367]